MAKFNKDSIGGTILVVLLLSLVCSIIVTGAAVVLKPAQEEQKALDVQRNILSVAGLANENDSPAQIKEAYNKFIEPRLVDLATGDYVSASKEEIDRFDAKNAVKDSSQSSTIPAAEDKAGIRVRANLAKVYLVKDSQGQVTQVVLPMYGRGLWSMMYGFVAVEPDGNTIKGITYYDQGETAGLGGEIANPRWQAQFVGKKLYDNNDHLALKIGKGAGANIEHGIDGLSGATLTTNGVQGSFDYWFSQNGFGPFLAKFKAGAN